MKRCIECKTAIIDNEWACTNCDWRPKESNGCYIIHPELNEDDMGFSQESFDRLYNLEWSHFWFRARNHLILWAIKKYFDIPKRFLEIGCGTGFVLKGIYDAFPKTMVTGSDISENGLKYAAKRLGDVEMVQFDATAIPYESEFDVIGCFDVLEHIKEDNLVLKQINKALVEGGELIITVPQHKFLWSQADERACHQRRYSVGELKNKLILADFEVIRSTSFVTLLFPLMVLARLRKRKKTVSDNAESELSLNRFINKAFEVVLFIERQLIKIGFNLPFGGSLMILARKAGS